ncbi:MAG: hypothetical protein IIV90_03880 [Oscillospiraceae bacterium]|nr:hypothetical protein [Oscillospiraceae bacterium]
MEEKKVKTKEEEIRELCKSIWGMTPDPACTLEELTQHMLERFGEQDREQTINSSEETGPKANG